MTRFLFPLVALCLLVSPTYAQDDPLMTEDWYASITGGPTFFGDTEASGSSGDISFDTGYNFNLAAGRYLADHFRVEGEIGWRDADMDNVSGDVGILSGMVNGYYDHPITEDFDLYLGAGLGAANIDGEVSFGGFRSSDDDTVLAYQFMAGTSFRLAENTHLTGGYRLWTSSDPSFGGTEFDAPLVHTIEVGVRLDF